MFKKILIIGPSFNKNPKSLGGATVLLNNFISYLNEYQYPYIQIKTNKFGTGKIHQIFNFLFFFFSFFIYINKIDVVFYNGSQKSVFFLYPIISKIALKKRKKIFLKMFGGNFDVCKNASKSNNDRFWNAIFLANAIFLETKFLVSFFEKMINEKTKLKWTPNVRQNIYKTKPVRSFSKKFVFISQIKKTKGIDEILEVVNTLPAEYTIDIYGPIVEDRYNEVFKRSKNYYGNLNPSQVITVLNNYDVLLLPTYYNGEGYPGIIIEAFSLGIPVITTNWKSIPEIVTNGENGILINIQDTTALKKAILQIDNKLYEKISFNAYKTFSENFDSERINSEIVHLLINS